MANIEDLKDVLKETLDDRGVLSEIRAKIRAEIFQTLNDQPSQKPKLSENNMIINELIREYLVYNDYQHSAAVFIPETGQNQGPQLNRQYIVEKLKIYQDQNTKDLPLLYGLVYGIKKQVEKDISNTQDLSKNTQFENKFPNQEETFGNSKNKGEAIFQ
ncbi:hypothetical protein PPERSA_02462 [Pseudocohnilembus persalinus]|uniref:FGFR1 oncogene partner (FOP) N-terminal dimerisation domain-containing protein n=1 Tax=Pseudocohnilembus persalinus TaxID=266149 RepID=A0A0V0QAU5_PSEPJ|nr:hypothetical protein PPERSA_02462 [Pseudocohnilembus persalinus]|eukprot:KRW99350.1 hypothetical protein PPERSA_02462 [Pseudocohnilembus persalinus]